jgi:hypothetical protein
LRTSSTSVNVAIADKEIMKTKTLTTDEKGKLAALREHLAAEIGAAWAGLYSSMEQLKRRHYYKLGELFIKLRTTFGRGSKGEADFVAFCRNRFHAIKDAQRIEYTRYRKKLGGKLRGASITDLPPLRVTASPHLHETGLAGARSYKRIVDEEIDEPTRFERELENENEMVRELAFKIINTGFRVLSVKMHPDKDGGSNVGMRRLNQAKKLLQDAFTHIAARRLI